RGPPDLPPRRRQRAPRPQQGPRLHRPGPRREHPPGRRGVAPHGGRRAHRARVLHLPVPLRAAHGARAVRARGVLRGVRRHAARRGRAARRQGPLQEGAPRRAEELHRHRLALRATRGGRDPHRHHGAVGRRGGRGDHPPPRRAAHAGPRVSGATPALLAEVAGIARRAGEEILAVYASGPSEATLKDDASPLTLADLAAHRAIAGALAALTPGVPLLSEEGADTPFAERAAWARHWLVDPL